MKIQLLIVTSALALNTAGTASAQSNNVNVVRQAVPAQKQVIVANSPQDLALQEEIRKIRAYNASVDSQVGISDAHTIAAPSYSSSPYSSSTYSSPSSTQSAAQTNSYSGANAYQGRKVRLFNAPTTKITYMSSGSQPSSAPVARHIAVTPVSAYNNPAASYTRIHRVVKNDTLYNLAKRNCVSVEDIQAQNALNSNGIRIGQALTLPASRCNAAKTIASTVNNVAPAQAGTQTRSEFGIVRRVMPIQTGIKVRQGNAYAVLPKDSLYSIGKRYCLSAQDLAGFNDINTGDPIQPGQILRLPSAACTK